jgi:hypothetical protein
MARYLPIPDGSLPTGTAPFNPQSPLMTIQDWAALASAPQRPVGTEVSVRETPVWALGGLPEHMFVHYDDGQHQLIARGGPTKGGMGLVTGWLDGSDQVGARVDPAQQSPDYGASYNTLATTLLPGVTADQAAAGARRHAQGVNRGGNSYGFTSNSNSYAADTAEPIFGYRPGDWRTLGAQTHLREDGAAPPSPLELLSRQFPDRASPVPYAPF